VFTLIEYDKVVLLDTDLLVRGNIDSLFERPAPAALRRHAAANFADGSKIMGEEFFDASGNQTGGINAGVMVLKPSYDDFVVMCREMSDPHHPEHHESRMPEQDYLTRFYVDQWHALGVQYNYQVHQIAFLNRKGLETCSRLALDYKDVLVIHFSACPKPRDRLLDPRYAGMSKTRFADEVLCNNYLAGMARDQSRHGQPSAYGSAAIEAQLRSVTWASSLEWFDVWEALTKRLPQLETLLGAKLHDLAVCAPRDGPSRGVRSPNALHPWQSEKDMANVKRATRGSRSRSRGDHKAQGLGKRLRKSSPRGARRDVSHFG